MTAMQRQLDHMRDMDAPPNDSVFTVAECIIEILRRVTSREARIVPDSSGVCFVFFAIGNRDRSAHIAIDRGGAVSLVLVDVARNCINAHRIDGTGELRGAITRALDWVA